MKIGRPVDTLSAENRQRLAQACGAVSDASFWDLKPQNSPLWYKTVNDWVDQYAKPQP